MKVHGLYAGSTLVPGDEPEVQRVLRARRIARHITKLGLAFRAEETPNWSEMLDLTKSLETILRREIALAEQDEQAEPS